MSSIRDILRDLDQVREDTKTQLGSHYDEALDEEFNTLKYLILESGRPNVIVEAVAVNVGSEERQSATEPIERHESAQPQGRDLATLISIGWKRLVDDLRQIPHDLFPNQTEEHS